MTEQTEQTELLFDFLQILSMDSAFWEETEKQWQYWPASLFLKEYTIQA